MRLAPRFHLVPTNTLTSCLDELAVIADHHRSTAADAVRAPADGSPSAHVHVGARTSASAHASDVGVPPPPDRSLDRWRR